MRALHIFASREDSAAENYATEVILGLHDAGIDQCVVMDRRTNGAAKIKGAGIRLASHALQLPGKKLGKFWLRRLITQFHPQIIHCWMRDALHLVPDVKVPVISWHAGYGSPRDLPGCTHFVSASRNAVARFEKSGKQAYFIPTISQLSTAPPADRHTLATPHDAKVLVSFLGTESARNFDPLFKAVHTMNDCYLWLVGEGSHRPELEKRAIEAGLGERIRFTVPRRDHGALLRAANACVLTSQDRAFTALAPKAWAAGTPLIASQDDGYPIYINDGIDGIPVPAGDSDALNGAIKRVLNEDNLRRGLIARGYAAYVKNYSPAAVIRQWLDLYRQTAVNG